ncbi:MAG: SurA N-terminal domain-containing protein [Proteobacteria bacterium]|nr:SurA N-terminal domain-containing protein [Pseudomonadota bacterium]
MLQDLRDQKNSGLIVILFAVIILVFVFMFGLPGSDSCASKSHSDVAQAGSHSVGYDMMRSQLLQRYDDSILSKLEYSATAKEVTRAISVIYLLADDAREAGIRVSDEELHEYITNWEFGNTDVMRYFYHKNQFSQTSYTSALSRFQLSAQDYEDYKRCEFLARRYLMLMSASVSVSDESLWQEFALQNNATALEAVRLTNEDVRATFKPLSDDEINTFETSGAADIEKYYNEHLGDFTIGAKAKLQQIVIQKNQMKLTNPGAKTVKTQLADQRAAVAKRQIDEGLDFAQAFVDYDEAEDKSSQGMTGLLSIDIMAPELQNALDGKKVGDIIRADLSDRIIIAKLVDYTEKVVTPLAEVKHQIAKTILDDRRISNRRDEAAANLLSLVQSGKTMEEALNMALYADVLAEQPTMPDTNETPSLLGNDTNSILGGSSLGKLGGGGLLGGSPSGSAFGFDSNQLNIGLDPLTATGMPVIPDVPDKVPVPTDLPIVAEANRAKVRQLSDLRTDTNYIAGIGIDDDFARDIRNASAGTVLAKVYHIDDALVIAKVVSKTPADREVFNSMVDALREKALHEKQIELVGNIEDIINLDSKGYGLWIKQKLESAESSGRLKLNNDYFNKAYAASVKRQQEREKQEQEQ